MINWALFYEEEKKKTNILCPQHNIQTVLAYFFKVTNQRCGKDFSHQTLCSLRPGSSSESEVDPGNEAVLQIAHHRWLCMMHALKSLPKIVV